MFPPRKLKRANFILRHLRSTPVSSMTKIVAETIVCQGTPEAMSGYHMFLDKMPLRCTFREMVETVSLKVGDITKISGQIVTKTPELGLVGHFGWGFPDPITGILGLT